MLPQMMPLPWLLVFFSIFIVFYSVSLYVSSYSFSSHSDFKLVKVVTPILPW